LKIAVRACCLLVALGLAGCASSVWERTERVSSNGQEGRLYVPKLYAPLLPGSIYPDRKVAVPARGRPALVVVCPEKGDCRKDEILEQAAERGMVVLVLTRPPSAAPKDDLLRTRAEASAAQIGWLFVEPTNEFLRRWTNAGAIGAAAAVLGPPRDFAPAFPSSLSKQVVLLFAALHTAEAVPVPEGAVLKLYAARPSGGLPREAFRDAVEWLAGELGAR
jgi:hypothetical protein